MPFDPSLLEDDPYGAPSPAEQRARDVQGLKIVQGEPATDYNAREVARRQQKLGVTAAPVATKFDPSLLEDDPTPTPPAPAPPSPPITNFWSNPVGAMSQKLGLSTSDYGSFVQGAAKGASAGLSVYPQAAFNMLGNAAAPNYETRQGTPGRVEDVQYDMNGVPVGGTPEPVNDSSNTWTNALAEARGQNAEAEVTNPYAFGAGQLAGGIGLGAATGGGSTLGALATRGALIGGAQGFSDRAYTTPTAALSDTGIGAGIGGALNTVIPAAAGYLGRSRLMTAFGENIARAEPLLARSQAALPGLRKTVADTRELASTVLPQDGLSPSAQDAVMAAMSPSERAAAVRVQGARALASSFEDTAQKATSDVATRSSNLKELKRIANELPNTPVARLHTTGGDGGSAYSALLSRDSERRFSTLLGAVPAGIAGAAAGAGLAGATGNDPWTGALYGIPGGIGVKTAMSEPLIEYGTAKLAQLATHPLTNAARTPLIEGATHLAVPLPYKEYMKQYAAAPDDETRAQLIETQSKALDAAGVPRNRGAQ